MMACDNTSGVPADGCAEPGYVFMAMNKAEKTLRAVDKFQQQRAWLAFPVAVFKKFGDDEAGNLAALIAYSALVAIFPLLLLLVTVLDIVLKNNPELQQKVLKAAVDQYPVIGPQLQGSIGHLSQKGIALAVAAIGIFIGALGCRTRCRTRSTRRGRSPSPAAPGSRGPGCAAPP
jgi:membrane protein